MYIGTIFTAALAVMAAGGVLSLCCRRRPPAASAAGVVTAVSGCAAVGYCTIAAGGPMFFLQMPIVILGAVCAIFSPGYLKGHYEKSTGAYWFFFNLTIAAMFAVTAAPTPFLFFVCWEIMGLASFALVAFDYKNTNIFRPSWIYLLACEAGGLLLMALFFAEPGAVAGCILALAGFGLKIGFPLLHVWLPEAHPAAPAPVSALMSGAMIQLGYYGLLFWCREFAVEVNLYAVGFTLLGLGCVGCVGGILFALPQKNLKTLLAYSSIENMGIIAVGGSMGFLGAAWQNNTVAVAGFAGALLHMLNHALLKGGLFLGAGAVQHASGSLDIDSLGGLLKRMPGTGSCFLLNSVGISGVPPFCGFVSEFLIYFAALNAVVSQSAGALAVGVGVLIILAVTGGIAGAVYAKCSCVFLGEPRSSAAAGAVEVSGCMRAAVYLLTAAGAAVTFAAPVVLNRFFTDLPEDISRSLKFVAMFAGLVWLLAVILIVYRNKRLEKLQPGKISCTWDCGYAEPSARMEYTGSAFVQPLTDFLEKIFRPLKKIHLPAGFFPEKASYEAEVKDPALAGFWVKAGMLLCRMTDRVHALQSGYLHFYILIVTIVLIAMLLWALVLPWSGTLMGEG